MLPRIKQEAAEWFHRQENDAARRLTETLHVGLSPFKNVWRLKAATQASE